MDFANERPRGITNALQVDDQPPWLRSVGCSTLNLDVRLSAGLSERDSFIGET